MKTVWIAGIVLFAVLPSRSAPADSPVLVSDKARVAGIDAEVWDGKGPWLDPQYIRIRNASTRTLYLDSIRFPADSIENAGYASPLKLAFAVRGPSAGSPARIFINKIPKSNPIALPAGDSIDVGLFEIGTIFYYAKSSASTPLRRYLPGDSILAPLALFAGGDSIGFELRAKIVPFVDGLSGISVRKGKGVPRKEGRTVSVDGRSISAKLPGARLLFR
jgi:hypothetical protein